MSAAIAGLQYRAEFISNDEEIALVRAISDVAFSRFEMRGVVAKRRVAFFGTSYGRDSAEPIPEFLLPLRAALAAWAALDAMAFSMALINHYPPGAPIGWHRDAPQFDVVAGVSLLSPCRMTFRPYRRPTAHEGSTPRRATHEIALMPRSAYILRGAARTDFEHHIPPVPALRYSITFRTLRSERRSQS
jgi:alkylated DNA repair dioxygenase AlkB